MGLLREIIKTKLKPDTTDMPELESEESENTNIRSNA